MELCKKDLEFVAKAEEKEMRDVKKSQGMKISLVFTSTFEKVKAMLQDNKPVRGGDFNSKEVSGAGRQTGTARQRVRFVKQQQREQGHPGLDVGTLAPRSSLYTLPSLYIPHLQVELIREKLDNLITTKPMVYLVNLSASDFMRKKNKWLAKIHAWIQVRTCLTVRPNQ